MRRTFMLVSIFLIATLAATTAEARRRPPPPQPSFQWDSRGWTMLGEQTVSGRVDKDTIRVGRYEGRFSKLTLVVLDSDLELMDFTINFGDGTKYEPKVQHYFRENARTRVIDLPPNGGVINKIDLKYRNLPGGGRARVQVWGFKIADAPPPPPPPQPAPPQWDSRGWTMLGEQSVSGRVDKDTLRVGRYEGRFNKLTLVVLDSDLELLDFTINFADRTKYEPKVQHYFRENARTRVIDLPPAEQLISHIDLKYRNLPGGGRARVQVWGFKVSGGPGPGPAPGQVWDSRGWEMLGEQTVSGRGRVDKDRITVGRAAGKFSKLMIVVLDSELEMVDMEVAFRRGQSFKPAVAQYFRESSRTRAIDLPDSYRGGERTIEHIDFQYRNLPGGGRARVQVWGFSSTSAGPGPGPGPAPGPVWDSKGWELLGEQTVSGRVDKDRINVGRAAGKFSKLMVVVLDSELEMLDMEVTFRRGKSFRPAISQYFRENTRTRSIDLPDGYRGGERTIEHIDFKYRNLPGGGRARVQVWGK